MVESGEWVWTNPEYVIMNQRSSGVLDFGRLTNRFALGFDFDVLFVQTLEVLHQP